MMNGVVPGASSSAGSAAHTHASSPAAHQGAAHHVAGGQQQPFMPLQMPLTMPLQMPLQLPVNLNMTLAPVASGAGTAVSPPAPSAPPPASLHNKPTFLETDNYRFLIMDAPTDQNLPAYIDVLKRKQVVVVARVCDPTYSAGPLLANGIKVLELPFPDGDPPPSNVVDRWLALVDQVFKNGGKNTSGRMGIELDLDGIEKPAIGVHCVAGLGRAPVLVAIALVEAGMEPFDAIAFIRKKRRGAINARQLKFIENYQPKSRKTSGCCTIQ